MIMDQRIKFMVLTYHKHRYLTYTFHKDESPPLSNSLSWNGSYNRIRLHSLLLSVPNKLPTGY